MIFVQILQANSLSTVADGPSESSEQESISVLMISVKISPATPVLLYQNTYRHVTGGTNLHEHQLRNLNPSFKFLDVNQILRR